MMKVIVALMAFLAVALSCPADCQGPACWPDSPPGLINGTCGKYYFGTPQRICFDTGLWHVNTQVFCKVYQCQPETFDNAIYDLTQAGNTKTGICTPDYWKGAPRRTCGDTGIWASTTTAAPCVPKPKCDQTTAGNANFTQTVSNATAVAGTCLPGYAGTPPTMDCIDGNWKAATLSGSCTKIQCPTSSLASATWSARDAPVSGSDSVVGTCDGGLAGAPTRDCDSDGNWSSTVGGTPCTNACPAVTISYAHATFPQTNAGQMSTGVCDAGYAVTPAATRKCNADGTWADNLTTYCVRNYCGDVDDGVGNAKYITTSSGTYRVGTCNPGFVGRASRLCQLDGTWKSTPYHTCTPA